MWDKPATIPNLAEITAVLLLPAHEDNPKAALKPSSFVAVRRTVLLWIRLRFTEGSSSSPLSLVVVVIIFESALAFNKSRDLAGSLTGFWA